MNNQRGFTLIELVIVIVLLGVLAAIAVPRFVNLEDEAQEAALNSTAAAITSAMNINYAGCAVNNHDGDGSEPDCRLVDSCGDADDVLNGGLGVYTIAADTSISGPNGTTLTTCEVRRGLAGPTKSFTAVKAGTP